MEFAILEIIIRLSVHGKVTVDTKITLLVCDENANLVQTAIFRSDKPSDSEKPFAIALGPYPVILNLNRDLVPG